MPYKLKTENMETEEVFANICLVVLALINSLKKEVDIFSIKHLLIVFGVQQCGDNEIRDSLDMLKMKGWVDFGEFYKKFKIKNEKEIIKICEDYFFKPPRVEQI